MTRTFRTPKGTDLPLINLRGKEYLEVKYRLVWFREEKPTWRIETEFKILQADSALAKAIIKNEAGEIVSMAHKLETKQGFADFIEKSETGAIGRALALIGYGTQFCADELDEGQRIVDAPATPKQQLEKAVNQANAAKAAPGGPGEFVIKGAKKDWENKTIAEVVDRMGLPAFIKDVDWWATQSRKANAPDIALLKVNAERFEKQLIGDSAYDLAARK
jgi:hypothetical protein